MMNSTRLLSMRVLPAIAGFAAVIGLVVAACSGDITITGNGTAVSHGCGITYSTGWPTGGSFEYGPPWDCPMHIEGEGVPVNYSADASLPLSSGALQQYQATVTTWKGGSAGIVVDTYWDVGDEYDLSVDGHYYAGAGGFDSNNGGYDIVNNQMLFTTGWATAYAQIGYEFGPAGSSITAPDSAGSGVSFDAHAATSDPNAVPPMSYSWSVNGNPISATGADVSLSGPSSGSMTIQVTTTDGNGVQYNAYHTVYACSDNQIMC